MICCNEEEPYAAKSYSHVLEDVCDNSVGGEHCGVRNQIVEIWDCHWLQKLPPICYSTEIDFSGDEAMFCQ